MAHRVSLSLLNAHSANFNGARLLEQTTRSVLEQGYPQLEYIVVDGGSTDGSMAIVDCYRGQLAHVICEPHQGHADALNKGLRLATGEVMCWINSDDLPLPGALHTVGEIFGTIPEVHWLTGQRNTAGEGGQLRPAHPLRRWIARNQRVSGSLLASKTVPLVTPRWRWQPAHCKYSRPRRRNAVRACTTR